MRYGCYLPVLAGFAHFLARPNRRTVSIEGLALAVTKPARRDAPGCDAACSNALLQSMLISGTYGGGGDGMANAHEVSMKLTPTIFREISFQVAEGNPWWGLLLANEYLEHSDLLHRALRERLTRRAECRGGSRAVRERLLAGAQACELSAAQLASVGGRALTRSRCIPTRFRRSCERRAACAPSRRRRAANATGAASRSAVLPR